MIFKQQEFPPVYSSIPKYPRTAQQKGIEGYAIIEVIVTKQGGVRDPVVIEEWPEGLGFGSQVSWRPRN